MLCLVPLQAALAQLDDREAEEARQKEQKKREAEAALKVRVDCPACYVLDARPGTVAKMIPADATCLWHVRGCLM